MKLYAMHDKKSQALSAFQVAKSDAVVSRDFAQAVLDPKSLLGKYAEDFELVCIGVVKEDVVPGELSALGVPMTVVLTAQQVLDLQPQPGARVDPAQLALMKEA